MTITNVIVDVFIIIVPILMILRLHLSLAQRIEVLIMFLLEATYVFIELYLIAES